MSEHEDGRELTGAAASNALANAMPRVSAIHKAQRELEAAALALLQKRSRHAQCRSDYERPFVLSDEDLEPLRASLEDLNKARAL